MVFFPKQSSYKYSDVGLRTSAGTFWSQVHNKMFSESSANKKPQLHGRGHRGTHCWSWQQQCRPSVASSWSLTDLVQRLPWECSGPRLVLAVAAVWQYWVLLWLHDSQEGQAGGGEALFSSNWSKSPSSVACWIWKDLVFGLLMFVYFYISIF